MKQTIESFIERVKVESNIHKFIQEDLIYKLITNFRKNYVKMNYPKKINNPLDIVLKFYKNYNKEYYEIILDGINSSRIIISKNETIKHIHFTGQKRRKQKNKHKAFGK